MTDVTEDVEEQQPLYRHTCGRCVFLGTAEYDGRDYDLYFCKQGHMFPTVIARGSSDAHDYTSGMSLAVVDPVLREAYERARARELIPTDSHPENEEN